VERPNTPAPIIRIDLGRLAGSIALIWNRLMRLNGEAEQWVKKSERFETAPVSILHSLEITTVVYMVETDWLWYGFGQKYPNREAKALQLEARQ
jgi:hypothetical protein